VANDLIEIKAVVREPGFRSKVAIWTDADNIDPIGSCVGQKGGRIQTIINELGGERVDIVEYSDDPIKFVANALSPAKVLNIEINEEDKRAKVKVASDQFSLAIGKKGQNVRLAARLTGWNIDIIEHKEEGEEEEVAVYSSEHAREEVLTAKEDQSQQDVSQEESERGVDSDKDNDKQPEAEELLPKEDGEGEEKK
jgi:N utilization substance protein A